jgi:hypothetical protein
VRGGDNPGVFLDFLAVRVKVFLANGAVGVGGVSVFRAGSILGFGLLQAVRGGNNPGVLFDFLAVRVKILLANGAVGISGVSAFGAGGSFPSIWKEKSCPL